MTVKIEGINKVIWRLAKTDQEITFDLIRQKVTEYLQHGSAADISEYTCYELVVHCIADALDKGLVKGHMFEDSLKSYHMHPVYKELFPEMFNNSGSELLKLIRALLNMIRFVQVREGTEIYVDFGQYDSVQDKE